MRDADALYILGCILTDLTPTDIVGLCTDGGFAETLPISNVVLVLVNCNYNQIPTTRFTSQHVFCM